MVAFAVNPKALYRLGVVLVARAAIGIVVKIGFGRTHAAKGKGHGGFALGDQSVDVVAHFKIAAGLNIDIRQTPTCVGCAKTQVIEKDMSLLGQETGAQPSVGKLAGHLQ